jgi:outer membrane protein insertion porin family
MTRVLITLMLAATCGFAQTRSVASKWPIEKLAVEGNHDFTAAQILAAAGLKPGQFAGKPEFDAARDRLMATGAFESIGYRFEPGPDGKGYVATFQVAEADPVYPVRFADLGVPDKDIEAVLRAADPLFTPAGMPPTRPVLDRFTAAVERYFGSKGAPHKIVAELTPVAAGRFAIVIHPERNLPAVAQVSFDGNEVIPANVLRQAIAPMGIGSLYTEENFRGLLDTSVRPLYEARGRVRVSFKIRAEPAADVRGVNVFVTVDEGQSYTLGKVAIADASPVDPNGLLRAGDFKAGDVANMDRVNQGLERIRKALRHAGYMNATVTSTRGIDDGKKTVDVAVHLDPGPRYTMGKLSIEGLDLDSEAAVRHIWTIAEGQPFDADYPAFFLDRVRHEGMFDNLGKTKSDINVNEQAHTADVTLTFAGQGKPVPKRPD